MARLRAVVVGLGSIGRRHLANLRQLAPESEIVVWRHARSETPEKIAGADAVVYDLAAALDFKPHLALLANPAPFHIPVGAAFADRGIHLFIEKPLSSSMDGVADLVAECLRRNLVLMVGYTLRFNPSLRAAQQAIVEGRIGRVTYIRAEVGAHLADWRPGTEFKNAVSARRALGGGAVLELSHEIDYVRWLGGEVASVSARLGTLGEWAIDVEDTAEIILQMSNGSVASIHLDMLQRPATRVCRIIGTGGTLLWDGIENSVQVYTASSAEWSTIYNDESYDRNDMYVSELKDFLNSVENKSTPAVTGEDGLRALEIALAVKRSHAEERMIRL